MIESSRGSSPPKLLWLDDERDPSDARWHGYFPIPDAKPVWLKTFSAFVDWIDNHGLPDAVCFDHDLGLDQSGFDAAKWLTEYCLDRDLPLPLWEIQSANPIGKQNIVSVLSSYERMRGTRE